MQSEMKMDKHLVQLESKVEKTLDIIKLIEETPWHNRPFLFSLLIQPDRFGRWLLG